MGFWTKDRTKDNESARKIPQEQMANKTKESTLTSVPTEDYDVIENEDSKSNKEQDEPNESNLPAMPSKKLRFLDESSEDIDEQEAKLLEKLEDLKEEKNRILEKQRRKESYEEKTEDINAYQPQAIYLTDAECLRETLRKLDYLILEINAIKIKLGE